MATIDHDPLDADTLDADVPAQAVKGLNEASRRARESGRPVVLVRAGQLIRIASGGVVVLKQLPARRKVDVGRKALEP